MRLQRYRDLLGSRFRLSPIERPLPGKARAPDRARRHCKLAAVMPLRLAIVPLMCHGNAQCIVATVEFDALAVV